MGLRINTNVDAMIANRNLAATTSKLQSSMEKLSSGLRINHAGDDAAGLGISEKMRAQVMSLEQAQRNVQDGVSLVQTAEGVLGTVHDILSRVRELAVEFNNGTLSTQDQAAITAETIALRDQIDAIGLNTKFNGVALLTGASVITLQVGADNGQTLTVGAIQLFGGATAQVNSNIFNFAGTANLASIDAAIANVASIRGSYGSTQNRLEYSLSNLTLYTENLAAAQSRIRDVDVAQEMSNFTKLQVMQQAGVAMLAQANQSSTAVLSLLR
jgi:flagellin